MKLQKIVLSHRYDSVMGIMTAKYSVEDITEILSYIAAIIYFINAHIDLGVKEVVSVLERFYNFNCDEFVENDYRYECDCFRCDESCNCSCHYGIFRKVLDGNKEPINYTLLLGSPQQNEYYTEFDMDDIRLSMQGITLEFAHTLKQKWFRDGIFEFIKAYSDETLRKWRLMMEQQVEITVNQPNFQA